MISWHGWSDCNRSVKTAERTRSTDLSLIWKSLGLMELGLGLTPSWALDTRLASLVFDHAISSCLDRAAFVPWFDLSSKISRNRMG
jgi:hypothetical protein